MLRLAPVPWPRPALRGRTHVMREPASVRVDVHAAVVDVRPLVEDRLRAVAVMRVDVEHRDAGGARLAEGLRGDRCVVQVAGAAVSGGSGVVAGRTAQRVGSWLAGRDQRGRGPGTVSGGADRLPAARADQGHRVVAEHADLAVGGRGRAQRQAGQHRRGREDVRHDPVPAVVGRVTAGFPVRPDRGQVLDERSVVDGEQGRLIVRLRWHDRRSRAGQRSQDHRGPLGHLGPVLPQPEPDLAVRLMPQAVVVPHHGDAELATLDGHHARPPMACSLGEASKWANHPSP